MVIKKAHTCKKKCKQQMKIFEKNTEIFNDLLRKNVELQRNYQQLLRQQKIKK